MRRRFPPPALGCALAAFVLASAVATSALAEVRGRAFELLGLAGIADWQDKVGLRPCAWFGAELGHRFEVQAERLHAGVRAGWDGCITALDIPTRPRIDMIWVHAAFLYGAKPTPWLLLYGRVGAGMMLADSTPSGGSTSPRTALEVGPGVAITLGPHVQVEVSFRVLAFENFQFGRYGGQAGTTWNPLGLLALGAQI